MEDGIKELKSGAFEMVLTLDSQDAASIAEALRIRLGHGRTIPDASHDDANINGRLVAEICRGWMEMREVGE